MLVREKSVMTLHLLMESLTPHSYVLCQIALFYDELKTFVNKEHLILLNTPTLLCNMLKLAVSWLLMGINKKIV